ncbi:LysR family transcriptional regulator [Paraburkholderia sp. Ac-20340]|uniref:LysR family transcriptional regulator n=1 Tax=Paraburkholderia sp. Ac-20340 TaxID=2703888 RepID=UPI001980C79A|nr:LysR family transcriptional regulator [Paraburkholderia sp. Ac-20340]MBN3857543.1 LysR family transcriptional regulator [Paraburkholderia sp. Ac-20340]
MPDFLHNLRTFVRVVEAGTFTAVAKEKDTTAAQISRAISMLEEEMQTVVLHRTTRHLSVTEVGARFYERAKAILADLDNATDEARNATQTPSGRIRVHAAPGLAYSSVASVLAGYQAKFPDVSVELKIEQSMPSLVEDGYDLSIISATQLPDSVYISQAMGAAYAVPVASAQYLARRGHPRTLTDLADHLLLQLESPVSAPDEWHMQKGADTQVWTITRTPFRANSPEALRAAILAGAGIGTLATYSVADDLVTGRLVRVLPQYHLRPFTVFAVYPSRRYLDAKVRTLLEHLRATLSPSLASAVEVVERYADKGAAEDMPVEKGAVRVKEARGTRRAKRR